MLSLKKNSLPWLLLIIIVALVLRLPYLEVIPASFDEVGQTSYAFSIAQGEFFPLVANDAYTGPFYVYLLAFFLRLGADNPMIGRYIILITGTLTVLATYGWVNGISKSQVAGLLAALFVAVNPDLILVNSHIGGATFLLPFFTTCFLWAITLAVQQDKARWLVLAGMAAGLALQSNPVAGLLIAGGGLWLLIKTRHQPRLGSWWPFWPAVLGLLITLVYFPVIFYNLSSDFQTVGVLNERSYLWQENPTIETTWNNWQRFSRQMGRQVSGVVSGSEQFSSLIGIPFIFLGLALIGLVYSSYRHSTLPAFVLLPFWLILPIFSNHYGFISVGRFTTLLIPVWLAVIAILLAQAITKAQKLDKKRKLPYAVSWLLLLVVLLTYPIQALFNYYQHVNDSDESGYALLELSRYAADNNEGEPVYISNIEELSYLSGVPYVPHATFLLADIHHEFLPSQQIIGRLYEKPEPTFLLLSDKDADVIARIAPLKPVDTIANDEASRRNFGLYHFAAEEPLHKPNFVLSSAEIPSRLEPKVEVGVGIWLLGCEIPEVDEAQKSLSVACYWQTAVLLPDATYVGFAHLVESETATLIAQDDHILGQEQYPINAWRTDEVIKEQYHLLIPEHSETNQYQLWLGIYTWPDLARLSVEENANNVIVLPSITLTETE